MVNFTVRNFHGLGDFDCIHKFEYHLSVSTNFRILARCGLGRRFHQDENLRAEKMSGLLHIEGEWKMLILINNVFVYQYS